MKRGSLPSTLVVATYTSEEDLLRNAGAVYGAYAVYMEENIELRTLDPAGEEVEGSFIILEPDAVPTYVAMALSVPADSCVEAEARIASGRFDFIVPGSSGPLHGISLTCDGLSVDESGGVVSLPVEWQALIPADRPRAAPFITWRTSDTRVKTNTVYSFDTTLPRHAAVYEMQLNGPGAKAVFGERERAVCYAVVLIQVEGVRCYAPCSQRPEDEAQVYFHRLRDSVP